MTSPVITPQIGDSVYLSTLLGQLHIHGVISDLDTPDQVSGSLEVDGPNMLLSLRAIMGPPGPAGTNAPIWDLQQEVFDSADDLPNNLTDESIDIGKLYMVRIYDEDANPISTRAYLWMGTHWEWFIMGYAGPAGPVPVITWQFELLDPDDDELENEITQVGGDNFYPSMLMKLKAPRGPVGPSTSIAEAPDVDFSTPPEAGDSLVYDGENWVALPSATIRPLFYTVPQAAFTDVPLAFGTSVQICAWEIPPCEWDVVPWVEGILRLTGIDFDSDPFIIGAEVRLGHPTAGTLVARGYGNIATYVNLHPHTSTNTTPNDAIAPGNGRAVVPTGSSGGDRTLYVSAFNDGLAGVYNFTKNGAGLGVILFPDLD
jgi:hypothetical protein